MLTELLRDEKYTGDAQTLKDNPRDLLPIVHFIAQHCLVSAGDPLKILPGAHVIEKLWTRTLGMRSSTPIVRACAPPFSDGDAGQNEMIIVVGAPYRMTDDNSNGERTRG